MMLCTPVMHCRDTFSSRLTPSFTRPPPSRLQAAVPKDYWTFFILVPVIMMVIPPLFCMPRDGSQEETYVIMSESMCNILLPLSNIPYTCTLSPLSPTHPPPPPLSSGFELCGNFFLGVMLSSVFAIPLVMRHVNAIGDVGTALSIISMIILIGTGVFVAVYRRRNDSLLSY